MQARLENQIHNSLVQGKHLILIGPPGTGKSKLAKEICDTYRSHGSDDYFMTTATSDWTTFDTIGGLMPDQDQQGDNLRFRNGIFLDCFRNNDGPKNKWLVVDEINRADIDKAFGSLFSVLTGDSITLNFRADNSERVLVRTQNSENTNEDEFQEEFENVSENIHEYVIPDDWRLIATMNTFDKASLYEMSYAFMRRFAFIPVGVPDLENIEDGFDFRAYLQIWDVDEEDLGEKSEQIIELWKMINNTRSIGPAIVEDLLKFAESPGGDWASAIVMHVFPQFEGLKRDDQKKFVAQLSESNLIEEGEWEKLLLPQAADFFELEEEEINKEKNGDPSE